jgi:hypothetical protein
MVGENLLSKDTYEFYPIYISSLGKGKIVGCSFPSWTAVPKQLDTAVGGKFMVRCAKWLAGRPVD